MLDFHRVLLADAARTLAFRDAIRRVVRPGDVVVDLGSGSGILAFFACEAGARRVYAIEKQHSADAAALVARHNGHGDRVVVLHDSSLNVELPERADVLVAELLGMFGINERIVSLALDARRRFLRDGAVIIPERVALLAVPVELPEAFERHVRWWSDPHYGIDLQPLRTFASNVVYATDLSPACHLAPAVSIIDVDLSTIVTPDLSGQARFVARRDGLLHGFGGWFSAMLAGVALSNAEPGATHWQQAYFPLETPVAITRGDGITLDLETHDGHVWRWRGQAAGCDFDQTTWLSSPPCMQLAT